VIDDVQDRQELVAITRNGRPAAYLMSAEHLAELEDTAFWLTVPGLQNSLTDSRQAIRDGRTLTTADVRRWAGDGMPDGAV